MNIILSSNLKVECNLFNHASMTNTTKSNKVDDDDDGDNNSLLIWHIPLLTWHIPLHVRHILVVSLQISIPTSSESSWNTKRPSVLLLITQVFVEFTCSSYAYYIIILINLFTRLIGFISFFFKFLIYFIFYWTKTEKLGMQMW